MKNTKEILIDKTKFNWEQNFPPIFTHTSVSFLKQCMEFNKAKFGNMESAKKVVDQCIKLDKINELKQKYPDAILLPVISRNKLPHAFAEKIKMEICTTVHICSSVKRKFLSGMERLVHRPVYKGIINTGKKYIIVDDIVSQGGTIAELRKFIINQGGIVCAITALTHSISGGVIAPDDENIIDLCEKYPEFLTTNFLKNYFNVDSAKELTNPQIKYLLSFKNTQTILNKIEKCRQQNWTKWQELNLHEFPSPTEVQALCFS